MPTPASKSKSTTRGYSYKKSEEEADIQRMRITEEVLDVQSREGGDGSDNMSIDSPLPPKEPSCINHGNGDAAHTRSGNAAGGVDSDLPVPEASTSATSTSITMFQGGSNIHITNATVTAVGGNANINK